MIRLTRRPTPQLKRFRGEKRLELERKVLELRRAALVSGESAVSFDSGIWKKAKTSLKLESYNKCGWCESRTAVVAHGDVEHIRPKSVYWWLAYSYHNYLYSCQICNQSHKGNQYPIANPISIEPLIDSSTTDDELAWIAGSLAPDSHATDSEMLEWYERLQSQKPLLLDPYIDDPELFLAWSVDHVLRQIEVLPAPGLEAHDHERAVNTIRILGLNRQELRDARYNTLRLLLRLWPMLGALQQRAPEEAAVVVEGRNTALDGASDYAAPARFVLP